MTISQMRACTKTVTRRLGWWNKTANTPRVPPGGVITAIEKGMGLPRGAKQQVIHDIRVLDVRREPLGVITPADCVREGFPELDPEGFVKLFGRPPETVITRIEFEHLADPANPVITEERRAQFDVDITPLPVARQVLEHLKGRGDLVAPRRVLCHAAGSGVWAKAAREVWPSIETVVGIEVRPEAALGLHRVCDAVLIGDAATWLPKLTEGFDLVCDNPPFSRRPDDGGRKSLVAMLQVWHGMTLSLLSPRGRLVLFGLSDWGQRSPAAAEYWKLGTPDLQLRVVGALSFRPQPGNDTRSYSAWIWRRPGGLRRNEWTTLNLPALPSQQRRAFGGQSG